MNIVQQSTNVLLDVGASPILYLMLVLSVISAAIMIERGWFFYSIRENLEQLTKGLARLLKSNNVKGARALAAESRSVEAAVVSAGLAELENGPDSVEEAMESAVALQRKQLERRLAFLGTLGNNAPFIGLLGTVIGIVQAFDRLREAGLGGGGAGSEVMGAIAEALVATAIGLAIAIPAVAAFNYFQRRIKSTIANTDALSHVLLAHLKKRPPQPEPRESSPPIELRLTVPSDKPQGSASVQQATAAAS